MSEHLVSVTARGRGNGAEKMTCVRCRKSEEHLPIFQQHHQLVLAALGRVQIKHFHLNAPDQEWLELWNDLQPLRPEDYIRVGTVTAGVFEGLQAVGIGPNKRALQRALNLALAVTVLQQLSPVVPEALRPLQQLLPPVPSPVPPPVPAPPQPAALPVKARPAMPPSTLERPEASARAAWLPRVAHLVAETIMPRMETQMRSLLHSLLPERIVDSTAPDAMPDAMGVAPKEEAAKMEADDAVASVADLHPVHPLAHDLFVDEVCYSQNTCNDQLQNGSYVTEVAEQIVKGEIDHMKEPWLVLEVFQMKSFQSHQMKYYSSDNRRLLILKLAQKRLPHCAA